MGVSFLWEVVKPTKANCFRCGLSSNEDVLKNTFGATVSTKDIDMLRAMHRAVDNTDTLWGEIADTLERLQGDDYDKEVSLRIWTQY